jgi:hypothetical protein
MGLQRVLGLGSYRTAWLMLHKLRQAMVRPGREKFSGVVEVVKLIGQRRIRRCNWPKTLNKVLIIVAAEADGKRIGRIRMALIEDFDRKALHRFVQDNIELESTVCTDGLNSYRELNGYIHNRKVQNLRHGGETCFRAFTWSFPCLNGGCSEPSKAALRTNISTITSMSSCFALIDVDLSHAESFSIVWLNRPSTPSQRHTRCSPAGGFSAWWSQVHIQGDS